MVLTRTPWGPRRLAIVREKLGVTKIRGIELSLLQLCAAHCASETDVEEAFLSGQKAVEYAAVAGVTDKMVGLERSFDRNGKYVCNIKLVDLTDAANTEKKVPLEWINARGNGVTSEFVDYVLPLIQGSPDLAYENGLPRFAKLKKVPAK